MSGRIEAAGLAALRASGAFRLCAESSWRRQRLLILCYHGISLADEHEWMPWLYLSPEAFERRMQSLRRGGYGILPLAQALHLLVKGDLPPKSVCITFDDGFYDFYRQAAPVLGGLGFPATVYLTSYYSAYNVPVFSPMCSYLLWQARGRRCRSIKGGPELPEVELDSKAARDAVQHKLDEFAMAEKLSGPAKHELLAGLARALKVDFEAVLERRILHLMSAGEVRAAAAAGFAMELHTHRHDTPVLKHLFLKEIEENRRYVEGITGTKAVHFCYPSGYIRPEFKEWLREASIETAATCEVGLATEKTDMLRLPRLLDASNVTHLEYEAWLCGIRALLPRRSRPRPVKDGRGRDPDPGGGRA